MPTSWALPQFTPSPKEWPLSSELAMPTPRIEPMSVCELEAGRPRYQVPMFQTIAGLSYAFPRAMARSARVYRRLFLLHARIQERPRIAAYLASERRIPFNQQGIFRHYSELDE